MSYITPEIGETLTFQITSKNPQYGLFVSTPSGSSGLVRKFNISWSHQNKFYDSLRVGEFIQASIKDIHPDGKLELSRKDAYPHPSSMTPGVILKGIVDSIESFGILIRFDAFIGLAPTQELSSASYKVGEEITCVVKNSQIDDKGVVRVTLSTYPLHTMFAQTHCIGDRVIAKYIGVRQMNQIPIAVISIDDDLFRIDVSEKYFIEPYKTKLITNSLVQGQSLEFVFSKFNESKSSVWLDMRPIEKENERQKLQDIITTLSPGDVVMGVVKSVDDRIAKVEIENSGAIIIISRDELSPNKVLRASDEVFVGEHIKIVYTGADENNRPMFSRKYIIKDRYDDQLYSLSLMDLLNTMDIHTNTFIGRVISINDIYFFTEMMSYSATDSEINGKLLVDPINGKNILVKADHRLRNLLVEGNYYRVEINIPNAEFRRGEGTPYLFSVSSNNIQPVKNPYRESVDLSFKQHTSPNTNTSVANLLEEVGQNLYTSKKRMFFELLQNADDAAALNGVKVKLQLDGKFFLLTHDGYSFNKHDFESITSAAKSTKSANKKKTGYKGIGFKSVFTNSDAVFIQSSGYRFGFDKSLEIYNDFDKFYFHVNDIENDVEKQNQFIYKYGKFRREFNGVKDIPWQLLPIWSNKPVIENVGSIWSERENVCIALQMDEETLSEYAQAIMEVFDEPRFMLFLRRTNRIQLIQGKECRTIQKNISEDGKFISLVNSFDTEKQSENYKVYSKSGIIVNDDSFTAANVKIKRKERINNRGEIENYYVRFDSDGHELSEVPGIPDRIASAIDTAISFAIPLDEEGHIKPISEEMLSLYAYLPMNEHRFNFPFFINADFIPKSDREGVQSDNPWNHFLFYNIGSAIVSMVVESASTDEPDYLYLLPSKEFVSNEQDTYTLIESFNNGYKKALYESKFIINDYGVLAKASDIILDESSLASTLGHDNYYAITGTTKRLPHESLNSDVLKHSIFNIEKTSITDVARIILSNPERINSWIAHASDMDRNRFFEWLTKNETTIKLIPSIPSLRINGVWVSYVSAVNTSKVILLTEKTLAIKDILLKLGFTCSDSILEQHPLKDYLKKQDEKRLFEAISGCDFSVISHADRLRLFQASKHFEGIGDDTLRKWALFRNTQNIPTPLYRMCAYDSALPSWLGEFMISLSESNQALDTYLIKRDDVYSMLVEPNIDRLLAQTSIYTIYQVFRQSWRHAFTQSLINRRLNGLLPIVEQEDSATKELFVRNYGSFDLSSNVSYTSEGEHYRIIKIAAESLNASKHLKSIIKVDGIPLSKISMQDDFSIVVNGISYKFSLSSILPSHSDSSKLALIIDKFKSIAGYENIFAQSEPSSSWVKEELMASLSQTYGTHKYSAIQYCFLMLYYKSKGYSSFDSTTRRYIDTTSPEAFKDILELCYSMKVGEILRSFINDTYVSYSFGKVTGRYIKCDNYTLPEERVQPFIAEWAISDEKKQFLSTLGVHNDTSEEIIRRKSFAANKLEDIWSISSTSIINTFLSWVKVSQHLPITEHNKVSILRLLFDKIRIQETYNEADFTSSKEWTDEKYISWKANRATRIYLNEGEMPYRGIYSNTVLFTGHDKNWVIFPATGHIYINKNIEPEVVLADVYSSRTSLFSKDDWREMFMISRSSVSDLMSEVERLRNQNNLLEEQLANSANNEDATMQRGEDSSLSKREMIDAQIEAQKALMRAYPDWEYPNGFGEINDDGQPYCFSCNIINTEKGAEPIVLKSYKYQGSKFMVNPSEYLSLIRDKAQLFIYDGLDFKRIQVLDLLKDQTKVSISFSSKNLESDDRIEKLANALHYFNNITFNFDSFNISSQAESIRHIYRRNEGTQITTTDEDL